jgi:hypothetical protein
LRDLRGRAGYWCPLPTLRRASAPTSVCQPNENDNDVRCAARGPRGRLIAGVACLVIGAGILGGVLAVRSRHHHDEPSPEPAALAERRDEAPPPRREPEEVRAIYAQLDRGEAPEPARVLAMLGDEDDAVRLAAVRAYARHAPPDRDPAPILPLLNDPVERVRLAAIVGLGTLADERAVAPLAALLAARRSAAEQHMAIAALGKIPTEAARRALIDLLVHDAVPVRQQAFVELRRAFGDDLGLSAESLAERGEAAREAFTRHLDASKRR